MRRIRQRSLLGDLIEGRWEEVRREAAVRLGDRVDRFARGWREMAASAGSFKRIGAPVALQLGGYTVVDVPLIAGRGEAIGKMVFDTQGKVAGPALKYPRRHRLTDGPCAFLLLGNPEILGLGRTRI